MSITVNDRIMWHDAENKPDVLPLQVVHIFDGCLVLGYDGTINDDPGNMRVAEPYREPGQFWIHGTLYSTELVHRDLRRTYFPYMSEPAEFNIFVLREVP